MKEDWKIGFSALVVGAISFLEAWSHILEGQGDILEIFFLGLGLVACLSGTALLLHRKRLSVKG